MGVPVVVTQPKSDGKEYEVAQKLADAGATNAWTAKALEPSNDGERKAIEAAVAAKLVVRNPDGRYWVDADKLTAHHEAIRWVIIFAVAVTLILLSVAYVMGEFSK